MLTMKIILYLGSAQCSSCKNSSLGFIMQNAKMPECIYVKVVVAFMRKRNFARIHTNEMVRRCHGGTVLTEDEWMIEMVA